MTKEKEKKVGKDQLLLEASRLGRLEQLESILSQMQQLKCKKRANPLARKIVGPNNIRDPATGFTCLHHAALNGHAECVQLMLDYGAKVNAVDYKGSSALHLAAWVGNLEVVRILLAHRLPPPRESQQPQLESSLQEPSQQQSPTQKSQNMAQSVEVDLCNNDNQTPLSLAAQFGHKEVVSALLANGASVLVRNSQLESPLDLACLNGRLETVDLLLRSAPILVADLQRPRASLANLNVVDTRRLRLASSPSLEASTAAGEYQIHLERLASTATSSPPPVVSRRQSGGGWSALLRGKRGEQGANVSSTTHQSPLHRLTSGTLSMRQSKTAQQQLAASNNTGGRGNQLETQLSSSSTSSPTAAKEGAANRQQDQCRPKLVAGASVPATTDGQRQQQFLLAQHQRQISADWAPLVTRAGAGGSGNLPAQLAPTMIGGQQIQKQREHQQAEKLLEHSPLHYATRRGHLNVINLLLYTYKANILQVSSRGSILHEIALNNGKHSGDIINAAFVYLTNLPDTQNRLEILDRFLNLKNANQQNIFEVLNEINNRSAQEIKRFIYEFSEQIHQMASSQQSQLQRHTQSNTQPNPNQTSNNLQSSSLQQQQMHQFSDINHISSFVTLKRAPKSQKLQQQQLGQQNAILADSTGRHLNWQQQQQLPYGTQTIDRRQVRDSQQVAALQQQQSFPQAATSAQMDQMQHQHKFQASSFGLAGQSPALTRSVSNLSRVSSQRAASNQHQQSQCQNQNQNPQHKLQSANLAWRKWQPNSDSDFSSSIDRQQQQHHQQQQVANFATQGASGGSQFDWQQRQQVGIANRKRRSRSRDLGSLLMEAQQQHSAAPVETASSSGQASPFDNAPVSMGAAATPALGSANLVRSQTDCSHLVGRYFGDHLGSTSCLPAAVASGDPQLQQQRQRCAQKHSTLDRKMINRHYHVYEHEFYPPRLLAGQPLGSAAQEAHNSSNYSGRQQMAFVPPLSRASAANEQGLSRASIRSTASCQVPAASATSGNNYNLYPSSRLIGGNQAADLGAMGATGGFGANNNSRLSLNIEPQASGAGRTVGSFAELDRRKQPTLSSQPNFQQQHQMDRFLHRHVRKSVVASCAPSSADSYDQVGASQTDVPAAAGSVARCASSADQRRQELVELQRRLIAEQSAGQQPQHSSGQPLQQQPMHTSYSLESHLSEPHLLFETTRQTLMKDFDQMIGNKLLNRDHGQIVDANLGQQAAPERQQQMQRNAVAGSQSSIFTGVSLDMDQFGERLTVSGTQLVVQYNPSSTDRCNMMMSPESNFSSNSTQTAAADFELDANDDDYDGCPPPKPPRLSLMSRQQQQKHPQVLVRPLKSKQLDDGRNHQQQATTGPTVRDQPSSGVDSERHSMRAESGSASTSAPLAAQLPPKRPKQPAKAAGGAQPPTSLFSGKPPPANKPPPVPCPPKSRKANPNNSKSLASALQILATSSGSDSQVMINSGSSTTSSGSGGSNQATVGLLKLASSTSSSDAPFSRVQQQQTTLDRKHQQTVAGGASSSALALRTAQSLGDPDSGVCTSNSPASLSHDSEDPPAEFQQTCCQSSNEMSGASVKRSKQSKNNNAKSATTGPDPSMSAVVKHLTRTGPQASTGSNSTKITNMNTDTNNNSRLVEEIEETPGADLRRELPAAPPSPSTAQLCIEEALMPLAKPPTTSDVANQTTSPVCTSDTNKCHQFVSPYSVGFVDRWLVEGPAHHQQAAADDDHDNDNHEHDDDGECGRRSTEADYDNCHGSALSERQLQSNRCRSIGDLLPVDRGSNANTSSIDRDGGGHYDEEGDYAADSSTTSQTSSNETQTTCSEPASTSSDSLTRRTCQDDKCLPVRGGQLSSPSASSSSSSSANVAAASKRKELVVRVMIDEPPLGSVGEEVFYINPLELKKLATPKNQTMDAETLTDEQLCAAFDKSSGFIRFTLKKRRNHQSTVETTISNQNLGADDSSCLADEQQQPLLATKKTKLNQPEEAGAQMTHQMNEMPSQLSCHLKIRRHSEMANQSTVGYNNDNKFGSTKDTHQAPSEAPLNSSQSQLQQVSAAADSNLHPQDFDNNNANGNSGGASRSINRLSAIQLRQWFSMNLVALCDYVDKFLSFGLDNVNFLNHPQLMNDAVLQMIGINQETHRVVILDRISNELTPVDFESLFSGLPANGSHVSLAKVFELLQMSHLQTTLLSGSGSGDHQLELSLADLNCIEFIKRLDLTAGYRGRLKVALDFIRDKILLHQQKQQHEQLSSANHSRPNLAQQSSSESSEIELDASHASSSSSKESIKSIVSMRTNQHQSSSSAISAPGPNEVSTTATILDAKQQQLEEQDVEADLSPTALVAEAPKAPLEATKTLPDDDSEKSLEGGDEVKKPELKQEQALVVGKAGRANSLVSEAARKLEAAQRGVGSPGEGGSALCFTLKPVAAARRINTAKIATTGSDGQSSTTTNVTNSHSLADSSNHSTTTSGQATMTTPAFVPVRSVCWPPKSNKQQPRINSSNGQFQQEQLAIGNNNKVIGPKPAPPAKPAKLTASKFGTNTSTNTITTTSNLGNNSHRF